MKYTLFIICFFISFHVSSQTTIQIMTGYGDYDMSDLRKALNISVKNSKIEGLELVNNYPDYFFHNLSLFKEIKGNNFGIDMSMYSTGARVHIADYSGEFRNDVLLRGYQLALLIEHPFIHFTDDLYLSIKVSPGVIFQQIKEIRYIRLGEESETERSSSSFRSAMLSGGGRLYYDINTLFRIGACVEFIKDFSSANYSWTGLRIGIGASYTFTPTKNPEQ